MTLDDPRVSLIFEPRKVRTDAVVLLMRYAFEAWSAVSQP